MNPSLNATAKTTASAAFNQVEGNLKEVSRWMFENPETAMEEHNSSQRLARFLGETGFEVTYPAYGIPTAFEATVGSSGPRVVICAEYDALPEVGHACGHNIIATSSLGAGAALVGLVDELGIRVTVLGTPGEEGAGGKIDLLKAGAFDDAAASMLIHPHPSISPTPAPSPHKDSRSPFGARRLMRLPLHMLVSTPSTPSSRLTTTSPRCANNSTEATEFTV